MTKKIVLLFIISVNLVQYLYAQNPQDSSAAIKSALSFYRKALKPETGLYNGRQYLSYSATINDGYPYFEYGDVQNGSVVYDNVLYENVPILFDVVKNEIVISDSAQFLKMYLNNEQVSSFTILNHKFIKLGDSAETPGIKNGFYEVLYNGNNVSFYKKQTKNIQEKMGIITGFERYIVMSEEYFLKKENKFYDAGSKKAVLNILKDKKNELNQFIKQNKLKLKKQNEPAFIQLLQYYDTLKK